MRQDNTSNTRQNKKTAIAVSKAMPFDDGI
jgi:hypothetical protein